MVGDGAKRSCSAPVADETVVDLGNAGCDVVYILDWDIERTAVGGYLAHKVSKILRI